MKEKITVSKTTLCSLIATVVDELNGNLNNEPDVEMAMKVKEIVSKDWEFITKVSAMLDKFESKLDNEDNSLLSVLTSLMN